MDLSCDIRMRFEEKVNKTNSCWEWRAAITQNGYGFFWLNGRNHHAHRVAWYLHTNEWPIQDVLHTCDNPRCVNPDHLFLGDDCVNINDKVAKNRQAKGQAIKQSKLTEKDVIAIRQSPLYRRDLATKYGVSVCTITDIKQRKTWKHL